MEQSRFGRDIFKVVGGLISPTLDTGKQSKVKSEKLCAFGIEPMLTPTATFTTVFRSD
jgi:hypothetical protein